MKRIIGATLLAVSIALIPAAANAAPKDPHQEETDGCDHGHTGKPCKDDPQPDHGKECEVHGNHGGVNEDHCDEQEPTTTTTAPPLVEEPTTTTTTAPAPVTTTEPTAPVTVPAPATDTPAPAPAVAEPVATPAPAPVAATPVAAPAPATELPHTGSGAGFLGMVAFILILAGVGIQLLFRPLTNV